MEGVRTLQKLGDEPYTNISFNNLNGTKVMKLVDEEVYGTQIKEPLLIFAPEGEYVKTSNVKEWVITLLVFQALTWVFLAGLLPSVSKKENHANRSNQP